MAITQLYPVAALQVGVYDGPLRVSDLRRWGNMGVGTYDAIDGEMIIVDGVFYQAREDGTMRVAPDELHSPWAMIAPFECHRQANLGAAASLSQLESMLDRHIGTPNAYFVFRIDVSLPYLKTRALPRQKKPYPPLSEVVAKQPTFEYRNVEGTIVGFRSPPFVGTVSPPGYHLHVVNRERTFGGHILELELSRGSLDIYRAPRFELVMPSSPEFDDAKITGSP